MSLEYKILYLHFKKGLSVWDIALIIGDEIRQSPDIRFKKRGTTIVLSPAAYVGRVIAAELEQIERLKLNS